MTMTRTDFNALAQLVSAVPQQGIGPEALASRLADFCQTRNPNFNRARFIDACKEG